MTRLALWMLVLCAGLRASTFISAVMESNVNVLVDHPRLNYKAFNAHVNVKSNVAKAVRVKTYLSPKYNSFGVDIPLLLNSDNFILYSEIEYYVPAGDSVITYNLLLPPGAVDGTLYNIAVYIEDIVSNAAT